MRITTQQLKEARTNYEGAKAAKDAVLTKIIELEDMIKDHDQYIRAAYDVWQATALLYNVGRIQEP